MARKRYILWCPRLVKEKNEVPAVEKKEMCSEYDETGPKSKACSLLVAPNYRRRPCVGVEGEFTPKEER